MKLQNIHSSHKTIYLFERDLTGEPKVHTITSFYPYYYEEDALGHHNTYDGKRALKIVANHPADIAKQRSENSYESDVLYTKRYIIDCIPTFDKTIVKYIFLDIEILSKDMPDIFNAISPISCITIYNSQKQEYLTWYLAEWGLDSEVNMLEDFIYYIKSEAPDMLLAWNIDFDYTYIYNRIGKLLSKKFSDLVSPINQSRAGKNNVFYPAGISIVDYMGLFEKLTLGKKKSYALDYIAQEDLGETSWGNTIFGELNEEIKNKNVNDVRRMCSLEIKYKLIPHFDEIRRFSKCLWEDLPNEHVNRDGKIMVVSNNSKVIDMLILQQAKEMNIVLPRKQGDAKEDFEGAYRDTLKSGVFYNLGKYDLSGAYLFTITDLCLDASNIIKEEEKKQHPHVNVNITDRKSHNILETFYVKQNPTALLPSVIGKLVTERNKYRELMKATSTDNPEYELIEQKYKAMKGLVLSAWGVIGNQYFRLYDYRIAAMITSTVRDLLHYVVENVKKQKYEVAYIDTDSVFISDNGINLTEFLNKLIQSWSFERFNKKSSINFEYEGHFEKILLLAKCHYYGYLKTPKGAKKEIKGVEVKRSSSSKYEAKFQDKLINKILDKQTKTQIISWLRSEIDNLKKVPLLELAFPCKIAGEYTKTTPIFVRAFRNTRHLLKDFDVNRGELFYYVFVKPKFTNPTDGKPIDVVAIKQDADFQKLKVDLDIDAFVKRVIYNKTENIFEVLNWGNLNYELKGQTVLF